MGRPACACDQPRPVSLSIQPIFTSSSILSNLYIIGAVTTVIPTALREVAVEAVTGTTRRVGRQTEAVAADGVVDEGLAAGDTMTSGGRIGTGGIGTDLAGLMMIMEAGGEAEEAGEAGMGIGLIVGMGVGWEVGVGVEGIMLVRRRIITEDSQRIMCPLCRR